MANWSKLIEAVQLSTGLRGDAASGYLFGTYGGYTIYAEPVASSSQYTINVSVRDTMGNPADQKTLRNMLKGCAAIVAGRVLVQGYHVQCPVKSGFTQEKNAENLKEALQYLVSYLQTNGYRNVCQKCGQDKPLSAVMIGNTKALLCDECYQAESEAGIIREAQLNAKPENVLGGIVGALLGSVIGVIVMVILGQLGYVAVLSGLVMGITTLKGYELLGGKLTTKGIIISCVIMVVMVYVGNRLDWAIALRAVFTQDSLFTIFRYLDDGLAMLKSEGVDVSGYHSDLAMQYIFSAVGAASSIFTAVKARKLQNKTTKIA